MHTDFGGETWRKGDDVEDLDVEGRVLLKWILKNKKGKT
jgi:hypothetical protein